MNVVIRGMTSIRWVCDSSKWQPSKIDWIRAAQCIQPEEAQRISKFVFKRDAKSSMVGRLMLRRVIHHVTKIPYEEIKLARTAKGKPFLENSLPSILNKFSFNVSHQGDLVVLAAETDCDVGIDVMNTDVPRAKSVPEFFHTMRRQFTEGEWTSIKSHSTESDQLKTFYRLWCLKESYVKALGIGIGFEVNRLDFRIKENILPDSQTVCTTTLVLDGQQKTDWIFEEYCIQDHCVAVAVNRQNKMEKKRNTCSRFLFLTVNELLEDVCGIHEIDDEYGETFINKAESPQQLNNKMGVR